MSVTPYPTCQCMASKCLSAPAQVARHYLSLPFYSNVCARFRSPYVRSETTVIIRSLSIYRHGFGLRYPAVEFRCFAAFFSFNVLSHLSAAVFCSHWRELAAIAGLPKSSAGLAYPTVLRVGHIGHCSQGSLLSVHRCRRSPLPGRAGPGFSRSTRLTRSPSSVVTRVKQKLLALAETQLPVVPSRFAE